MFVISPDAWATVVAVVIICVTIVTVFATKLEEKKRTDVISKAWVVSEIGTSIVAAYVAWEVHPHITWMPVLVTQPVFTVLAIHGGISFLSAVRNKTTPS